MVQKILIVEDDLSFGTMMQNWFLKNGFGAVLSSNIEHAKKEIINTDFCLILTDLRLPDGDGIMLLAWIKEWNPSLPVIIMTSYAEIQSAVSAIKLGAADYLEKPITPSILKQKITQALAQPAIKHTKKAPGKECKSVLGNSLVATQMNHLIKIVAPTRMSVVILGESGTGKEYVAHQIHDMSDRASAPFIAVDCGSLSRELAPSELFGHLKGSFTSAISDKKGVFEQANGGTVFLDEVGNLPYEVQMQLLRALQEKKVRPVGAAMDIPVDVRIIVATNENLETAIASGKFREDLYHRLNEFAITVPPLRERRGDIAAFAKFFLREANDELSKNIESFSNETLKILEKQHWSGNLRELRNVVRRAALFAQTNEITPENLPLFPTTSKQSPTEHNDALHSDNEKERIMAALKKTRGNKTAAALLLEIDRKTLYNKMHLYGMEL